MEQMDIGIAKGARQRIVQDLSALLADTYTLYLKTHNFHWNVTGPMFQTLHLMFEEQYRELWGATDVIAERIRALGEFVPGTYRDFASLTSIPEPEGVPDATDMIRQLVDGHETAIRTARGAVGKADENQDEATLDLLTQRLQVHEKTAWMLRSLLA